MANSWVIIHRAPAFTPQAFVLLFIPCAILIVSFACIPSPVAFLQVDFDGDQAAIFLPLTTRAQREAGEHLSSSNGASERGNILTPAQGFSARQRGIMGVLPGLSLLTMEGRQEIARILDINIATSSKGHYTNDISRSFMARYCKGTVFITRTLEVLEALMRRGFEIAKMSGASISPFVGSQFALPATPEGNNWQAWDHYKQEVCEWLARQIPNMQTAISDHNC